MGCRCDGKAVELTSIHRFTHKWEGPASLQLREGNIDAVDLYVPTEATDDGRHHEPVTGEPTDLDEIGMVGAGSDDRVAVEGVFNDLDPDETYDGEYRLRYFAGILSYRYAKNSALYAGYRLDSSRATDGSELRNDLFGLGFNYSF